jgi:squalene-hopene/tetraprenyl-beta-curcumene cyclase
LQPDVEHQALLERSIATLLASRAPGGYWEGYLSSSALSTATAIAALAVHARETAAAPENAALVRRGIDWLVHHRNPDGGWGDTVRSASNISTTLLAWAALAFAEPTDEAAHTASRDAASWIVRAAGSLEPSRLAAAITGRYGRDRTFSVPILTMCALAGRLGGAEAWRVIPALPFELAAAPRALFAWLRLPVVSYALPALVAIGLARHRRCPTRNPAIRLLRDRLTPRVLRILEDLQPSNGGFLEATPLTSFVAMSLIAAGEVDHPVVARALAFVRASVREDGSWPIDTHLATWVTTLAVNALQAAHALDRMPTGELRTLSAWIASQQHAARHVYTGTTAGGWAWTPLPGGVPDGDDTAGAVLALAALPEHDEATRAAVGGIEWLLRLQNRDGGIPTFCRGWGALPFDRSGADLTAHAIRAWTAWAHRVDPVLRARIGRGIKRAVAYLRSVQRSDGAFLPLWFGNEAGPAAANPTYGTARVLVALVDVRRRGRTDVELLIERAARWLVSIRNCDGGWGGDDGLPSSIEETALAVGALAEYRHVTSNPVAVSSAIAEGHGWIAAATRRGEHFQAAPIGLYFAKLWYSERLYPLLFAVEGIGRALTGPPNRLELTTGVGAVARPHRAGIST